MGRAEERRMYPLILKISNINRSGSFSFFTINRLIWEVGKVVQAFLIMAYKNLEQLVRLIQLINENALVFVHLDKKSKTLNFRRVNFDDRSLFA